MPYPPIDEMHSYTGNFKQIVGGELIDSVAGLAICRYEKDDPFYPFGCDENWMTLTDTCHQTFEEAKEQAEFEYQGVSLTWKKPEQ